MRMVIFVDRYGVMEIVRVGNIDPPPELRIRNAKALIRAKSWLIGK